MLILGVDPGTIITGYGIIDAGKNSFTHVVNGSIKLASAKCLPEKLEIIYDILTTVIRQYKPDEFAIETAFYGRNVQSALKIGYARGAAILAAVHNKLPASEYSPREVKKSVAGTGAASKEQVSYMIKSILSLKTQIEKMDESDALAVALCHAFRMRTVKKSTPDWKSFIAKHPERVINS
jgi:crossover junction endodeoxyribonuclease RuvC